MENVLVWAIGTAAITAGVWLEIVLVQKHRRLVQMQERLVAMLSDRLDQLDAVDKRLADAESRLEFAERVLPKARAEAPPGLPPAGGP